MTWYAVASQFDGMGTSRTLPEVPSSLVRGAGRQTRGPRRPVADTSRRLQPALVLGRSAIPPATRRCPDCRPGAVPMQPAFGSTRTTGHGCMTWATAGSSPRPESGWEFTDATRRLVRSSCGCGLRPTRCRCRPAYHLAGHCPRAPQRPGRKGARRSIPAHGWRSSPPASSPHRTASTDRKVSLRASGAFAGRGWSEWSGSFRFRRVGRGIRWLRLLRCSGLPGGALRR